ncbi:MAG TPA: acyl-CoA dehydrogenase family protein, partial [Quisquiliibacterium sp.]|nr:acyl-CoA dehydrogenase family protein [Quisquiliibacterium sp.]
MDFSDTPDEAAFRAEVRAFLEANARRRPAGEVSQRPHHLDGAEVLAAAKAWQAKKAEAGFVGITWDRKYGGRGGTQIQQVIYHQEESAFDVPRGFCERSVDIYMPTMIAYASPQQLERYLRPAMRGEEIWCQLFSEPAAGSDLAALRTRAERDGDHWVVNGQKVWTSRAHFSDYGLLVTRTDPEAPKHAGLTFFFVDMRTPGIELRRIRQIGGSSDFNEVFFKDVRIPDSQRLGEVNGGWKVAMTTLQNERLATSEVLGPDSEDLFLMASQLEIDGEPAIRSPAVREKLADWLVQTQGLKYTRFRTMTALSRGRAPGPEATIGKLVGASKLQDIASFGIDLLGLSGAVMDQDAAPMDAWFQQAMLYAPG